VSQVGLGITSEVKIILRKMQCCQFELHKVGPTIPSKAKKLRINIFTFSLCDQQ
jgi:hypothetical protein